MRFVAVVELVIGVGVIGLWTTLLLAGKVPEIPAGDRAIYFHIAAEYVLGVALAVSGLLLLLVGDDPWIRVPAAAAVGGMIYSTINSPGYYARQGKWGPVVGFAGLTLLGVALVLILAW
jgi:hypothetical protein